VGMMSLQYHYYSPTQWVLARGNDDGVDDASSLANGFKEVLGEHFLPNAIVHELTADNVKELTTAIPYLSLYAKDRENTLLYRCSNYSCDRPMERLSELKNYLDDD
jgi:hypothetical protein